MNDAELALSKLDLLLTSVANEEESISNAAVEALENCGAPEPAHATTILHHFSDPNSLRIYWAATLLGRLFAEKSELSGDLLKLISDRFTERISDSKLEESARERICWAITNFPGVEPNLRQALQDLSKNASPRMLRLIEKALSKP